MAITVSLLGTPTFNTTSGTKTVTATPAAGDLIIIITAHSGNTSTAAPTDNNSGGAGTYTLINSAVKATSADTMRVWVRDTLIASGTSTTFTHAPGTTTGGGLVVIDCQGMDKAGSAAIVKSAIQSNQAAGGTPAPVFASAVNSQNAVIGAVFNASNPAGVTQRTNFTELYDSGYNNPTTGLEVMSRNSGETGTTMTWGSTSATAYASLVVELEASVTHATTGTLTGQGSTIVGSAQHRVKHVTTGTLTGQGSTIVGSATNFTPHSTTGTLTGPGSVITGDADREPMVLPHIADGALTGQGSTLTGSATRFRQHPTTGTLTGQGSVITGDADREPQVIPHIATGVLVGPGATITGSATRFRQHTNTGSLTGPGSSIVGQATLNEKHDTTGALTGSGAILTGTADHLTATHEATGDLVGSGAVIVGSADHISAIHSTTGDLIGAGAVIAGNAQHITVPTTSAQSGIRREVIEEVQREALKKWEVKPEEEKKSEEAAELAKKAKKAKTTKKKAVVEESQQPKEPAVGIDTNKPVENEPVPISELLAPTKEQISVLYQEFATSLEIRQQQAEQDDEEAILLILSEM